MIDVPFRRTADEFQSSGIDHSPRLQAANEVLAPFRQGLLAAGQFRTPEWLIAHKFNCHRIRLVPAIPGIHDL
jgi:hypothetical protein